MDINKIENITLEEAKAFAHEEMQIKGHTCIFTDLKGAFGYSVLVFKNGRHIYFANDYALHHGNMMEKFGTGGLRLLYIKNLNLKLFTDEELMEGAATYDEYRRKDYFLRNLWIMQFDHVSSFDARSRDINVLSQYRVQDPLSMCYLKEPWILEKQRQLHACLHQSFCIQRNDPEGFRKMIRQEMYNHEACITCSADEALKALNMNMEVLEPWQRQIVKAELRKQIADCGY